MLYGTVNQLSGLDELGDFIARAIVEQPPANVRDGGVIADSFDPELDRLRSISRDGQTWLAEYQAREIQRTGISTLKVGFNQVFGYYIEIGEHPSRTVVPMEYAGKQTLKNAERYITGRTQSLRTGTAHRAKIAPKTFENKFIRKNQKHDRPIKSSRSRPRLRRFPSMNVLGMFRLRRLVPGWYWQTQNCPRTIPLKSSQGRHAGGWM